jgi:adenylate cyclase
MPLIGFCFMFEAERIIALQSWLAAGAPPVRGLTELCEETGKRLTSTNLPVDQFALYTNTIHPGVPGNYSYWTKSSGIRSHSFTPQQLRSHVWMGSAAQVCCERGRVIVHTFGQTPDFDDRPETSVLQKRGYTQFVYTPLHSNYTFTISVAAYGTTREGGFSDEEVHTFRLLQSPLARVVEGMVLYDGTVQILSTYVGRDAGSRVLGGNILRGDTEAIPAVVLFADLCDFTSLSNHRPAGEVIGLLNKFFDAAGAAITNSGGEILKFMGDGLLAIFPTPDDINAQLAAATNAVAAIEEMRTELERQPDPDISFRAALDVGDIYYGNIGSSSRLDFTAIGPTVNRAARLLGMAEPLAASVVCSATLHKLLPGRTISLGMHSFKGFDETQEVYKIEF